MLRKLDKTFSEYLFLNDITEELLIIFIQQCIFMNKIRHFPQKIISQKLSYDYTITRNNFVEDNITFQIICFQMMSGC